MPADKVNGERNDIAWDDELISEESCVKKCDEIPPGVASFVFFINGPQVPFVLKRRCQRPARWMFNRPGVERLRALDQNFYVILQIQSFGRGTLVNFLENSDDKKEVILLW